jgi:hypothetical protein
MSLTYLHLIVLRDKMLLHTHEIQTDLPFLFVILHYYVLKATYQNEERESPD